MSVLNIHSEDTNQFNNLSIRDLLQARSYYHIFLTQKLNVVGTAIGRYLVRDFEYSKKGPKPARTLFNSSIRDTSWPCILVLVDQWEKPGKINPSDLVPKTLYLPDGRMVPVCIVEAPRVEGHAPEIITETKRIYPTNVVAGGFPLISRSQGQDHLASVGCLLSDGHKAYALTNRHVVGEAGTPIYARRTP
jgi:hypothetical protein